MLTSLQQTFCLSTGLPEPTICPLKDTCLSLEIFYKSDFYYFSEPSLFFQLFALCNPKSVKQFLNVLQNLQWATSSECITPSYSFL